MGSPTARPDQFGPIRDTGIGSAWSIMVGEGGGLWHRASMTTVALAISDPDALSRLRGYIERRGFAAGDRLPPERALIDELGLTRGALRRALATLEREGAIWRHVGKGTFVAGAEETAAGLGRTMTPPRMMQARICIEPALAREAALHATARDMAEMGRVLDRAEAAGSWPDYEAQDDAFHRAVAEACDNALLVALFDELNTVRRAVAWGAVARRSARPPADHTSHAEHRRIIAAIAGRDAEEASVAMRRHLKSVADRLFP